MLRVVTNNYRRFYVWRTNSSDHTDQLWHMLSPIFTSSSVGGQKDRISLESRAFITAFAYLQTFLSVI